MLGLFPYLRLESSYKDIHWCSWMASFLAVLVALVCSLAAVDHGNHRQEECVCFKTDPYGSRSFSAPPGLFVVFWNIFIHYVLITFFPLTQFLPAPSLLPNCMFLLSGEKEGEREKRKKEGRQTKTTTTQNKVRESLGVSTTLQRRPYAQEVLANPEQVFCLTSCTSVL